MRKHWQKRSCQQKKESQNTQHSPILVLCKYLPFQNTLEVQKHLPSLSEQALNFCLLLGSPHLAPSIHSTPTYLEHVPYVLPLEHRAGRHPSCPPLSHLFKATITGNKAAIEVQSLLVPCARETQAQGKWQSAPNQFLKMHILHRSTIWSAHNRLQGEKHSIDSSGADFSLSYTTENRLMWF